MIGKPFHILAAHLTSKIDMYHRKPKFFYVLSEQFTTKAMKRKQKDGLTISSGLIMPN